VKPFVLIAAGLVLVFGIPDVSWIRWPVPIVATPELPTSVVYVYEKDQSAIPVGVTVGLNRLNRERHIVATLLEADTTDGTGDVPEQYREALAAATASGLPALVVLSGTTVLSVTPAPEDAEAIVRSVP
jgi:hypothetical protein